MKKQLPLLVLSSISLLMISTGCTDVQQEESSKKDMMVQETMKDKTNNVYSSKQMEKSQIAQNTMPDMGNDGTQDPNVSQSVYQVYTEKAREMLTGEKPHVLYFHADWCPACRQIDGAIQASIDDLPKEVTILKVNYDKETSLKAEFGITSQTSFVLIDSNGNKVETLTAPSFEQLKNRLNTL